MANDANMANDCFYEEESADFSKVLGEFKTDNPIGNRFQRQFIHLSSAKSKFKKTVELVLCVHGWKAPDRKIPMSLIILGIDLQCNAQGFRFESVRIWLGFHEDTAKIATSLPLPRANPKVVAFAPFVKRQAWNTSDASVTQKKGCNVNIGFENIGKAEANMSRETQVSYTRRHFDRGTASRLVDDRTQRIYGVEWYLEQNKLQRFGVEPHFHVAVLVEREHTSDGIPVTFSAVYDMRIEAGFRHDISQGIKRAFRLLRPEDTPVYFDPSQEDPDVNGLEGSGQRYLQLMDKENLGKLAEGDGLSKLLDPVGHMIPGLEPLVPPGFKVGT